MIVRLFASFALLLVAVLSANAAEPATSGAEPVLTAMSINYAAHLNPALLQPARGTLRSMVTSFYNATAARFTTLSTASSVLESLDAMPVVGTVRRRAGRRFNTEDASMDDFAICYRLTSRLGLQVIPGDPSPVKLAVTSIANNTGVTFGMTWRMSQR